MVLEKLVVALLLSAAQEPRFHLLDARLTVAAPMSPAPTGKSCPSLFPKLPAAGPEGLSAALPGAAPKKSLVDAFARRTRASVCAYGLQGVRRQDPRFGMRQITLELPAPLAPGTPLHLMLRTVVGPVANQAPEVYAGISY